MAADPRHLLGGVLTLTMFLMLGDMVKRDYYDTAHPHIHNSNKASSDQGVGLWKEDGLSLKPCWEKTKKKPLVGDGGSEGYVTLALTNGPEYHVSQIADAVVVARYLRAKLVIPEIRGNKPGEKWNFEDVYDSEYFLSTLDGVVEVVKSYEESGARNVAVVKIPNRVTEDFIAENIEAPFRANGNNIRLVTYFPSVNMKQNGSVDSVACLGMFGTLILQQKVRHVVDSMIDHLRSLSPKSDGRFVGIDLRIDVLEGKGCSKSCYDPREIALFLSKFGFDKDTTLYVTQTKWDTSLDALKDMFPNTFTKESILPVEKKDEFLESEELEKVIDFYICSESDVFVPAISGLMYANVAGKRIASGKTQILVPGQTASTGFISHYVANKNHLAYSCFC